MPFGFVIVSVSVAVPDIVIEVGGRRGRDGRPRRLTVELRRVVAVLPVTALGPVADATPVV